MDYLAWMAHQVFGVAHTNRFWMGWNLLLAFVPACLAVVLFAVERRRNALWWAGVVVFTLFLPNAPYVLTDLLHLRGDVNAAATDRAVVAGVLPVYAMFVLAGFAAYLVSLDLLLREVRRWRPSTPRLGVELPVHLLCAVGIILGRMADLNSWQTVTAPGSTLEQTFTTLTWRGAPLATLAVFVAVAVTATLLRVLAGDATAAVRRLLDDRHPSAPDAAP